MEQRLDELINSSTYLKSVKCDTSYRTLPFKCAVPTCQNKFLTYAQHKCSPFKFHNFPDEVIYHNAWKRICKLPLTASTKDLKVCSDHFTLESYKGNLIEEVLKPTFKRSLKDDALPFVKVYYEGNISDIIPTEEKLLKEAQKQALIKVVTVPVRKSITVHKNKEQQYKELQEKLQSLKEDLTAIKIKIDRRQNSIANTKRQLKNLEVDESSDISDSGILTTFLSKAQINVLKGKKKVFWTNDDLAHAFDLRHSGGKEFYLYLKNTLNYPIPSLSCLQAWAAN